MTFGKRILNNSCYTLENMAWLSYCCSVRVSMLEHTSHALHVVMHVTSQRIPADKHPETCSRGRRCTGPALHSTLIIALGDDAQAACQPRAMGVPPEACTCCHQTIRGALSVSIGERRLDILIFTYQIYCFRILNVV